MITGFASRAALAVSVDGVVAVLQQDGTVKTWGPSRTAAPVSALPYLAGVKAIFPHTTTGAFVYLLDSGSMYVVSITGTVMPLATVAPVIEFDSFSAIPGGYVPNPLALLAVTGGGMYVNDAHEFVCASAGTNGAVPALLLAPYFKAGVKHAAANDDVVLLVLDDGTLTGWGIDLHGLLTPPVGTTGVVTVAAGAAHAVALLADGTVKAWGDNSKGQTNVPAGLSGVVELSVFSLGNFTLARKSDGTVAAWGDDTAGQCTGAASVTGATKVSAGTRHGIALTSSTPAAWGDNSQGQITIPGGTILDVAAGDDDTTYVSNGGLGYYGASGKALPASYSTVERAGHSRGTWSKIVRQADSWIGTGALSGPPNINGANYSADFTSCYPTELYPRIVRHGVGLIFGELCHVLLSQSDDVQGYTALPFDLGAFSNGNEAYGCTLANVVSGASSPEGVWAQAIAEDGSTTTWGVSDPVSGTYPTTTQGVLQIAMGRESESRLLADGSVQVRGSNTHGETDLPTGMTTIVGLGVFAGSGDTYFAAAESGQLYIWGYNATSSFANLSTETNVAAVFASDQLPTLVLRKDRTVALSPLANYPQPYGMASEQWADLVTNGVVVCGATTGGELLIAGASTGFGLSICPRTVAKLKAAGTAHFMAENTDESVAEWSTTDGYDSGAFAGAPSLTSLLDYAGNDSVSLGVVPQAGGGSAVIAWGPGSASVNIPTSIMPGASGLDTNPVTKVACGTDHYMALFASGSVLVWGDNTASEISNAPSDTSFRSIAAGYRCCMGMDAQGNVTTWGGSYIAGANGITGATAIASHPTAHGGAVQQNGNVTFYGYFGFDTAHAPSPATPSWTDVQDIAVGYCSVLGRQSTGALLQWAPHLSNGTNSPVKALPGGLPAVIGYCPTSDGGYAVDAAHTPYAWGSDPRWPVAPNDVQKVWLAGDAWGLNVDGSLVGLGDNFNPPTLPPPFGLSGVTGFATGVSTTGVQALAAAVTASHTLVMWGYTPAWTPSQPVQDVSVSGVALMVLYTDGTVAIASADSLTAALTTVPAGLTGTQIGLYFQAPSSSYAAVLCTDGTVQVWGDAGLPTLAVPAGLTGVTKIAIGPTHIVALKSDHSVVAWGTDANGSVSSVNGQTGVADIAVDGDYSLLVFQSGAIAVYPEPAGAITNPMALSGTLPNSGSIGTPYNAALSITGAFAPPATLDATASSIPAWMSVDIDGAAVNVSGTPTAAGTIPVVLAINDASTSPQLATTTQSINVTDPATLTYVKSDSGNGGGAGTFEDATISVAGAAIGDTILISLHVAGSDPSNVTSALAGSVPVFENVQLHGSGTFASLYLHTISSDEISSGFAHCTRVSYPGSTKPNISWIGAILRGRSPLVDSAYSQVVSASTVASPAAVTANGVTTTVSNEFVFYLGMVDIANLASGSGAFDVPAGFTVVANIGESDTFRNYAQIMGYKQVAAPGNVPDATSTYTQTGKNIATGAWLLPVKAGP